MSSVSFALSGIGTRAGATCCVACAQTLSLQTAQASIAPNRSRARRIAADIESGIGSRKRCCSSCGTPNRSRITQIQRLLLPRQLAANTGTQDRTRVVSVEGRRAHTRADIDGNAVNAKIALPTEITHRGEPHRVGMAVEITVSQAQTEVLARSQGRGLHRHSDGSAGSQLGDFRECRPAVGCKVALAVGGDEPQRPALPVSARLRIDAGRLIGLAYCTQYDLIVRGRCRSRANRGRVRIFEVATVALAPRAVELAALATAPVPTATDDAPVALAPAP